MKMIDTFMNFVKLVDSNESGFTHKLKVNAAYFSIMSELKKKKFFTAEDLYNYAWIVNYGAIKFEYDIEAESGIRIYLTKQGLRLIYSGSDERVEIHIDLHIGNNKFEMVSHHSDGIYNHSELEKLTNDSMEFEILKIIFKYYLDIILRDLIKEKKVV